MEKTIDDYFCDWESDTFGYGYGTGEDFTIPALQQFIGSIPESGCYDYKDLPKKSGLSELETWLFINIMCEANIIEYGTSPRYGWLSKCGKRLKEYLEDKAPESIFHIIDRDEDYHKCYKNACNCGENGYEKGRICQNPFWIENLETK